MRNFWRGFRKASDLREREENEKIKQELLHRIAEFIDDASTVEDEQDLAAAIKAWDKTLTDEEVRDLIRQLRIASSDELGHDL